MAGVLNPLDAIKQCIDARECFVLQGGAGSGKTETLKEVLEYVLRKYPDSRLACITHTNLAVTEIQSRVNVGNNRVSTIHSFLNDFLGRYKKNIHSVIIELFRVPKVVRGVGAEDDAEYKKVEHENYKKIHKKYASVNYTLTKEVSPKAVGKRDYDKSPEAYNRDLNDRIDALNDFISKKISETDYSAIHYNETRFDDLIDLSYGHDGLLTVAGLLFNKYPTLGRILEDRFDFIFIDEYQDTNEKVVDVLVRGLPGRKRLTVGLFGDSMQAIYEDGIGSVDSYVKGGVLKRIQKEDNFRCSEQVLALINKLRYDGLKQELAFKKKPSGEVETREDRQGGCKLFYSVCETKPTAFSSSEDKSSYERRLDDLVLAAGRGIDGFKTLMLTNKSISVKAGFENLYEIYSKRYVEPREYIDRDLERMQLLELCQLVEWFNRRQYNPILCFLRKQGFSIKTLRDKVQVGERIQRLVESDASLFESLNLAQELELIRKSNSHSNFIDYRREFLSQCEGSAEFCEFKAKYRDGYNTFAKMVKLIPDLDAEAFRDRERDIEKEEFLLDVFSERLKFREVLNYVQYENEEAGYMTMHKTKGSSIDSVVVVLDEYQWAGYKFGSIFQPPGSEINEDVKAKTLKLMYVACSRAKRNLHCVRLIESDEESQLKEYFDEVVRI